MKKLGLIGEKLGHSYSKTIHERYFELSGKTEYTYDLLEISKEALPREIKRISKQYHGINVTIPYKLDIIKHLTSISEEANKIGAVNTVKFTVDGAYGYNTDYFGFKSSLMTNGIGVRGKDVVILGTGGASKAALAVCDDMGAKSITFVTSGKKQVPSYKTIGYSDCIRGDILINCTPVGMYPNTEVSPVDKLDCSFFAVIDMIYNPAVTELMKKGRSAGAITVNGLYMLVAQAIYSQAIWNEEKADDDIIKTIYDEINKLF